MEEDLLCRGDREEVKVGRAVVVGKLREAEKVGFEVTVAMMD